MKIIPLSEGSFTIDQTKIFVPFNHTKDELQHRTTGSLLVEVQPFVIITSKDILLIDTGPINVVPAEFMCTVLCKLSMFLLS